MSFWRIKIFIKVQMMIIYGNHIFFWTLIQRQQYCHNLLKMKTKLLKTWKEQFKFCMKFSKRNLSFLDGRNKFPMIKCGCAFSFI